MGRGKLPAATGEVRGQNRARAGGAGASGRLVRPAGGYDRELAGPAGGGAAAGRVGPAHALFAAAGLGAADCPAHHLA